MRIAFFTRPAEGGTRLGMSCHPVFRPPAADCGAKSNVFSIVGSRLLFGCIIVLALVVNAQPVVPPVQVLSIGSTNAIGDAEATNVIAVGFYIWQTFPSGDGIDYLVTTTNLTKQLTNKQDLDALNTSLMLRYATNVPSYGTNKNLPFTMYAGAINRLGIQLLYCNFTVNLVASNGSYQLPPMPTQIPTKLYAWGAFPFPGIKSALVEAQTNGMANGWTPVMDSRWSSNPWYWNDDWTGGGADVNDQWLVLPTAFVTGGYPLRIAVISGTTNEYQLMNETGYLIQETPTSISESFVGHPGKGMALTVTAQGGDPGRSLVIQRSSDLQNWITVTTNHVVGYIGVAPGFSFSEQATATHEFYRVATTNAPF